MAKITAYKFVNPGLSEKSSPAVKAASQTTLAVNRLGVTVESIAKTISDLGTVSALKSKLEKKQEVFNRRQKRLEKDAEAENQKEQSDKKQVKEDKKSILTYGKKLGKGFFGILENLLSPLVNILSSFGVFAFTSNILEYLSDEENREKIVTFLEKTEFVFNKLSELAGNITKGFQDSIDFVFGKETKLEERLNALGKIAMAIGGIAGMIAAAEGIRELFEPDEDLPDKDIKSGKGDKPDKPRKPIKPSASNPSGADPDAPGPRGRPPSSAVKAKYGNAAEAAYKKILKERGDDAAKVFLNALDNSGGNVTKAQQRFNSLVRKGRFPKIEPPKPGLLGRVGNFFGGIRDSAVKQGARLRNFAVDQGGRLIQSLKDLPSWAAEQYNNMSAAARKKWDDVSRVSKKIAEKGNKWASSAGSKFKAGVDWIADGGSKFLNNMASGAKNFFFEKVLTPLKPIIDPIAKKASQVGQGMFDMLSKIPGAEKITEVLKKKGINGINDIAGAGSKLGKRAAAILPVVGGIVNLAFAYDRAANGDSIGALIEGTSGILDIAGLATGGAGSVASMLLDGYMFARDFIPQLQQGEEAVVDAVGARGLKDGIDKTLSKLPNIGEIINMLIGKGNDTEEKGDGPPKSLGGIVPQMASGGQVISTSHPDTGSGYTVQGLNDSYGRPAVFSRGGAAAFGKMMQDSNGIVKGSDIASSKRSVSKNAAVGGVPNSNHLYGNALDIHGGSQTWMRSHGRKYGWVIQDYAGSHGGHFNFHGGSALPADNGGGGRRSDGGGGGGGGGSASISSPFDPKAFIAFFKMIGIKKPTDKELEENENPNPPMKSIPTNTELSSGNLSEQHALAEAVTMIPIPVVISTLVGMPTPVQINKPSGHVSGAPSSLSKRMS